MDQISHHQTNKKKSSRVKQKKVSPAKKQGATNGAIALENPKHSYGNEQLRAIGASTAALAHEMTKQLNMIYGAAQSLEQDLARRKRARDDAVLSRVSQLRSGLEQLGGSVKDLRSLEPPQRLRLEPRDLVTLVRELAGSIEAQYGLQGIHVRLDVAGELPAVAIDPHAFTQALLNLFKNAVEAMPPGGTLTVRLYRSRQTAIVEIKDTGIGIPEDATIVEPSRTTKPQGTCRDTAVGRQVVSAHGGPLTYASRNGNGSAFRISLPMEEQAKKTVHITWQEARRAETEQDRVRPARHQFMPRPPSILDRITARLSRDISNLKATALRLWNAKNEPPINASRKRSSSRAMLPMEQGRDSKTEHNSRARHRTF
jgi:K+-sensing histidine kinase KdpD